MNINRASSIARRYFKIVRAIPGYSFVSRLIHGNRPKGLEKEVFGMRFYNPVGLGSGLDKRGDLFNELEDLGFSFVEIGPLNAKATHKAVEYISKHPQKDILLACISSDHQLSFCLAYDFCDAFVIEIGNSRVEDILDPILDCRLTYDDYKPLIVKIPKDISTEEIDRTVDYCRVSGVDGIETRSIGQTEYVHTITDGRFPIIANCQILTPEDAHKVMEAGASLIEVTNGLVTEGPWFVGKILRHLSNIRENDYKIQNKPSEESL